MIDSPQNETPLTGGVSSDIRIVHSPNGDYVVKRALEKLRVDAEWFSDPARSSTEVKGLRSMAELIGQSHVPTVLWSDDATHQFAMEVIDTRFQNWKEQLLRGDIDVRTARAAGRLLGELHTRSTSNPTLAQQFDDRKIFLELRIRPFFERVAERNARLAAAIANVIDGILSTRIAFVHGDYSPKNLLVDGGDVVILDCEVAHWGDPRFDVAFCLAHLLLKSMRRGAPKHRLLNTARAFLREYQAAGMVIVDERFVQQVGCLMLARLEGDSPVNYLGDLDTTAVKAIASALILRPPQTLDFASFA